MQVKDDNQSSVEQSSNIDTKSLFNTPRAYVDGSRKRLHKHFGAEWWLNVDYLESEIAA